MFGDAPAAMSGGGIFLGTDALFRYFDSQPTGYLDRIPPGLFVVLVIIGYTELKCAKQISKQVHYSIGIHKIDT